MAILASLPSHNHNLFTNLPSSTSTSNPNLHNHHHPPPIPVPKYPPKPLKSKPPKPPSKTPSKPQHPSFTRIPHYRSKYYKPIPNSGDHVIAGDGDRAVIIGESGVSYLLPDAPFEFQFSYSETPKAKPLAIREPAFLPFAPPSMPRPWTGKAPLKGKKDKKKRRNIPLFDSFNSPINESEGLKVVEMPAAYKLGEFSREVRSREEVLGEPLSKAEIKALIQPLLSDNRQVNLGRDGLTHNMLELIHSHWKRQQVCKVKCKGVPTVDMDNVSRCLEEKTGGQIIHRTGGVVYLFRGRNYNYNTRPKYPLMLWKPAAPVYPKLIQDAPGGLAKEEADELRRKGKSLLPICKLAKNGVYVDLVNDVRHAFEGSTLVKVYCRGLDPSDYKKIGAKLMELVPCILLSFENEQILMWRGHDWKSMYPDTPLTAFSVDSNDSGKLDDDQETISRNVRSSTRMMSLWEHAIESNKAILLVETDIGPDALLEKVEEFELTTQAAEHSYAALLVSNEDGMKNLGAEDRVSRDDEDFDEWGFDEDDNEDDDEDPSEEAEGAGPLGSLPVDLIAKRLHAG